MQGAPLDAELVLCLPAGEPALVEQALLEALEFVGVADPLDVVRVECVTGAGAQAALVEHMGDLGVGVFVEERIDLSPDVIVGDSQLLSREGARQRQRGRGPTPKADGGGDLPLFDQRDILDQEAEHAFALSLRGLWVSPDGREVGGQGEDALAFVVVDREPIGFALALILLLGIAQGAQLGIPVRFEGVGDESIRGVDLHVAVPRSIDFVLDTLDLAVPQTVGFVEAGGELLLHGQG